MLFTSSLMICQTVQEVYSLAIVITLLYIAIYLSITRLSFIEFIIFQAKFKITEINKGATLIECEGIGLVNSQVGNSWRFIYIDVFKTMFLWLQYNLLLQFCLQPRYNWNIVESGVKYHKPNLEFLQWNLKSFQLWTELTSELNTVKSNFHNFFCVSFSCNVMV